MKTGSVLEKVRKELMSSSTGEAGALAEEGAARLLWSQIQDLKREMNQAKKEAADEAAKPYLEAIEKIERRYAIVIKLTS
jgi:hypothetical protein